MTRPTFQLSRRNALGLIGAAISLPQVAQAAGIEVLSGTAFGTHWQLAGGQGRNLEGLRSGIEGLFAQVDLQFSPWRPDSAISLFNLGVEGMVVVDPSLLQVTAAALEIARQSEGRFDPTVGPLVSRWGFGPIDSSGTPDWRGVTVAEGRLSKARDDLTLDLCGIAKGWALDQAALLARSEGFEDLLLEIGGEFLALGAHPEGRSWRVAVESPLPLLPALAALHLPPGTAVATSGVRAQSFVLNGRLYSHIIDPLTRTPVEGALRSVTVVAEDAMTADGWATALFAAGDRVGPELAAALDIAALFLIEDRGALRQVRTGRINPLIL